MPGVLLWVRVNLPCSTATRELLVSPSLVGNANVLRRATISSSNSGRCLVRCSSLKGGRSCSGLLFVCANQSAINQVLQRVVNAMFSLTGAWGLSSAHGVVCASGTGGGAAK